MIKARHIPFYVHFFDWYTSRIIKKDFNAVKFINCGYEPKPYPALAIGNHFSWWDGFWMMGLNKRVIGKKFHILMLEEQLKNRMFLNKFGAAGLQPKSHDVINAIDYCAEILQNPNHILFYFPEGEIRAQNSTDMKFKKGVLRIIEKAHTNLQLLFVANLTEYFSNRKPTLFTFYKTVDASAFNSIGNLQQEYNRFLMDCKLKLSPGL